jgi:hypothetical protein
VLREGRVCKETAVGVAVCESAELGSWTEIAFGRRTGDAGGKDRFFYVMQAVALVMSDVALQNGDAEHYGGAIHVVSGTAALSNCVFSGNTANGGGPGNSGGDLHRTAGPSVR